MVTRVPSEPNPKMGSVTCLAVFLLSFKAVNSAALGSDFSGLGGTATLGEGSRKKGWRLTSPHPRVPGLLTQAQAEAGLGRLVPVADTKAGMENGTGLGLGLWGGQLLRT